jgi:cytochrome c553
MSALSNHALGVMLAAVFSLAATANAQNGGDVAAGSPSPEAFPPWAYTWDPNFKAAPADDELHQEPGSAAAFSFVQARDLFFSPDWHPRDHPPLPDVVARGRKPEVCACGCCHRAEGTGGPENSSIAGLPPTYIVQQMADFKSGARKFSGPQRAPVRLMIATAKAATEAEVQSAANYFAALKLKPNIKLVESATVPKTYIAGNFFAFAKGGGTEQLGQRILEVPVEVEQFELRDSRAEFVVYAPLGSVARGEALVKTGGGGRTVACAVCHGADLKGLGPVPGIAGRSPSYAVRQLYDFKHGARAGSGSVLMKPTVEHLSFDDMIALAAYLASLPP